MRLEDHEPTFVYASGSVNEKIKSLVFSAEEKSKENGYPIYFWVATCPRLTEINLSMSDAERSKYVTKK